MIEAPAINEPRARAAVPREPHHAGVVQRRQLPASGSAGYANLPSHVSPPRPPGDSPLRGGNPRQVSGAERRDGQPALRRLRR